MRTTLVALAIFVGLFFACRGPAHAALRVCDATSEPVAVAIAVFAPGATGPQSQAEGWFQIDSGACQIVIDTDLDPTTRYYLFAKSATIAWTGTPRNASDALFCTDFAGRFHYVDRPSGLCSGAGEQMLPFINEPVSAPDWTIDLDTPA